MAVKIKLANPKGQHPLSTLFLRVALLTVTACIVLFLVVTGYYYFEYQGIVDARLKEPLFADTAKIFAAPREVRPGQKLNIKFIANDLREAGYTPEGAAQPSQLGTYREDVQEITVRPGPQ
jgi:penicillin-binding protein 1B